MIEIDVQGDVAEILNKQFPDTKFIVDSQNGVHPKTVFGIVGEVTRTPLGTMKNDLRLKDGKVIYAQPFEFLVNVGVQGREDSNASDLAMMVRFLMNTPVLKRAFRQNGYAIRVDDGDTRRLPITMNTDVFLRHSFSVWLTSDVYMSIDSLPIKQVDVTETFNDLAGTEMHVHHEVIGDANG